MEGEIGGTVHPELMGENGFDESPMEKVARSRQLSSGVAAEVATHCAYDTRFSCFFFLSTCLVFFLSVSLLFSSIYMCSHVPLFCSLLLWLFSVKFSSTPAKAATATATTTTTTITASASCGSCTDRAACATFEVQLVKTFPCPKVFSARFDKSKIVLPQSHLLCLRTAAVSVSLSLSSICSEGNVGETMENNMVNNFCVYNSIGLKFGIYVKIAYIYACHRADFNALINNCNLSVCVDYGRGIECMKYISENKQILSLLHL